MFLRITLNLHQIPRGFCQFVQLEQGLKIFLNRSNTDNNNVKNIVFEVIFDIEYFTNAVEHLIIQNYNQLKSL